MTCRKVLITCLFALIQHKDTPSHKAYSWENTVSMEVIRDQLILIEASLPCIQRPIPEVSHSHTCSLYISASHHHISSSSSDRTRRPWPLAFFSKAVEPHLNPSWCAAARAIVGWYAWGRGRTMEDGCVLSMEVVKMEELIPRKNAAGRTQKPLRRKWVKCAS